MGRIVILMQLQTMRPSKFRSVTPLESARKIYREEGIRAFWRGNGAAVVHRFPYSGSTFFATAFCKRELGREGFAFLPDWAQSLLAGGVSGGVACTLAYPLDVVKTRLAAQTKTQYYRGITDALQKICLDEGRRGLYGGLSVSIASVVPMLAMNFMIYDVFHDAMSGYRGAPILAGGMAGALSSAVMFPVDLIRRQMQMVGLGGRPKIYTSVFDAVRQVFWIGYGTAHGSGGIRPSRALLVLSGCREFYRGLVPELVKVTPNTAIMFSVNDYLLTTPWPFEAPG